MTQHPPILIADDDPSVRHILVRIVRLVVPTAQIVEVSDGRMALTAVAQQRFDLVITDYHMPHATGLDVLQAVRAQSQTTPVIVISARGDVEALVRAAGATSFLMKPFTTETLARTIRHVLP